MSMSGFWAGALVGLVAGLLLAPDKGENTRANLANSAEKWKERLNKLTGLNKLSLDDLRAYLDGNIEGLPEDVRSRIHTILNEAEEMSYTAGGQKSTLANGVA